MAKKIMDGKEMEQILRRAAGVAEKSFGRKGFCVIGIKRRGAVLADRMKNCFANPEIPVGYLDINLYRDDFSKIGSHPVVSQTDIFFNLDGRQILLVDDVLFTGRTIRAALDAITDLGRPSKVKLFVLVDRGHRELPIQADFTGKVLDTSVNEMVEVKVKEIDKKDEVLLLDKNDMARKRPDRT
ncbi:MAG TPA: bifunctional pyr operon transcriptional regulator/uracil phosphoribosyltransferase PyrR [bacterium]|nr:bifunctional pyr operon transcriptional regulator/uracil phosphoribosyltransferase PyrR [bacterium]